MGFKDYLKRSLAEKIGREEGKRLPKKIVDFLNRTKGYWSGPFLAATGWSFVKDCPPLIIFDIPFSPTQYMTCNQISILIALIGGGLVGAGLLNSDAYHNARQGRADVEIKVVDKETGEEK